MSLSRAPLRSACDLHPCLRHRARSQPQRLFYTGMQVLRSSQSSLRAPFAPTIPIRAHTTRPFSSGSVARARPSSEDHYDILGVSRTASKNEIRDKFYEVSLCAATPDSELTVASSALAQIPPRRTVDIDL